MNEQGRVRVGARAAAELPGRAHAERVYPPASRHERQRVISITRAPFIKHQEALIRKRVPAARDLGDGAAHELQHHARERFVRFRSVTELAVHAGAEREHSTLFCERNGMVHAAGDVRHPLEAKTFDLRRIRSVVCVAESELAARVLSPSVNSSFFMEDSNQSLNNLDVMLIPEQETAKLKSAPQDI